MKNMHKSIGAFLDGLMGFVGSRSLVSRMAFAVLGRKNVYRIRYFQTRGRWPHLKHPKDLSEILISRILSDQFADFAKYADKVEVRRYLEEKGLGKCLLEHYRYWDNAADISLDGLPERFVLKASNGSGGKDVFVCRDKKTFDLERAKASLAKVLAKKYKLERQYNVFPPKVICEELIDTGSDALPTDYKFICIHGEPVGIFIVTDRGTHKRFCIRNTDWSEIDYTRHEYLPAVPPPKPAHLEEMLQISRRLAEGFDFVRVDLYEYKNQVYFGELTCSPGGGLMVSYNDRALRDYGKMLLEGSASGKGNAQPGKAT